MIKIKKHLKIKRVKAWALINIKTNKLCLSRYVNCDTFDVARNKVEARNYRSESYAKVVPCVISYKI